MEITITEQNRTIESVIEMSIIQRIHEIRGMRVMLDFDLAKIYEVATSNLNKAVQRNLERFPEDFMFQLTIDEFHLIFQNGTSSWGGTRKLPFAFTEQGVAMLSGVLRSQKAIQENIKIMRAFVANNQGKRIKILILLIFWAFPSSSSHLLAHVRVALSAILLA